jgi:Peptidase family M1 domain
MRNAIVLTLLVAAAALAIAQPQQPVGTAIYSPDGKPLSQRVVDYRIDVRYDAKAHTADATETLIYHNLTGQAQDTFPFHLYLNAFQPQSTFAREARRFDPGTEWNERKRGAIDIQKFVADGADLTAQIKFIAPDDGNADDRTVMQVKLPRPVPPGASVRFDLTFHDQFPETVARTGYKRDFIMGAQWFPKVGVWWHGAWNCHQFHATTEFFADFGTYDVRLTMPQNYVAGASGVELGSQNNSDGTKTLHYYGEDIHDFAWTASPHYVVATDTFNGSAGQVTMRALVQATHSGQSQRYLRILKQTLDRFDRWYGPYPYKQITLIDPEPGSAAGGMEYPTLFTAETFWWCPSGLRFPEVVTEHEFGHQYWYGMVATNEFEEAWLDEGINQYTETKIMDDIFGPRRSDIDLLGVTGGDSDESRLMYISVPDTDPMTRPGWQFMNFNAYGGVTYGKTATVLHTLEGVIGEQKVREGLRTYFMRYRFTHPTGSDFLKTLQEVAGRDLRPFFAEAVYGTNVLDFEVSSAHSEPLNWWKDEKENKNTVYRTNVVIHRKGDFVWPVDVAIFFENGGSVRETWNGVDRWVRYTYDKKAKLKSVVIDPDNKLFLDDNRFNNSRLSEPDHTANHKLANYWLAMTQLLSQMFSWIV